MSLIRRADDVQKARPSVARVPGSASLPKRKSAKYVAWLEDDASTIEKHLTAIRGRGLSAQIFQRPFQLGDWLAAQQNPACVKAFVLDMHIGSINDLSEIDLPNVTTRKGDAVGFAVANAYLRGKLKETFGTTPIAFLTGYNVDHRVRQNIEELRRRGNHIEVIDKRNKTLDGFSHFLNRIAPLPSHRVHAPKAYNTLDDYKETLSIGYRAMEVLDLSPIDQASLFGLSIESETQWTKEKQQLAKTVNIGIQDRIDYLVELIATLEAVFGDDVAARNEWLRVPFEIFGAKSAIELLVGGHERDIVLVLATARRMTG